MKAFQAIRTKIKGVLRMNLVGPEVVVEVGSTNATISIVVSPMSGPAPLVVGVSGHAADDSGPLKSYPVAIYSNGQGLGMCTTDQNGNYSTTIVLTPDGEYKIHPEVLM